MHTHPIPTPFEEADPVVSYLETALLPDLEFKNLDVEIVVETLRHLALRALTQAGYETPGGVSITLLATRAQWARMVTLSLPMGASILDAIIALADEAELTVVHGALGILLCPLEVGEAFQAMLDAERPLDIPITAPLDRRTRLQLAAKHPVLTVTNSPIRDEWTAAYWASDRTPEAAFALADSIVAEHPDDGCRPLTQATA